LFSLAPIILIVSFYIVSKICAWFIHFNTCHNFHYK
jgi:hypothetical protein